MKKIILLMVLFVFGAVMLQGCGSNSAQDGNSPKRITIAYQGGIGYAPVHVMETEKLIEKNYNGNVEVKFIKLDSGAAVNEGIIGGTIDIGCMGLAPAVSGVSKGVPYKAIANLCSQSHGLMSNDQNIKSIKQITGEDKIALVSTGSIQHILLGMAAEKNLGDAHALDNNIQRMSHAEGMAALEAGVVKLH
uniref:ABC transporter substrate-binding protein n=1 Tax=Anaerovibrio sp. TaxID=1872532 RepID=UPI0025DE32BC